MCSYKLQKIISFTDIDSVQNHKSIYIKYLSKIVVAVTYLYMYETQKKTIRLIFIHLYKINNTKKYTKTCTHTHTQTYRGIKPNLVNFFLSCRVVALYMMSKNRNRIDFPKDYSVHVFVVLYVPGLVYSAKLV